MTVAGAEEEEIAVQRCARYDIIAAVTANGDILSGIGDVIFACSAGDSLAFFGI